MKFLFLFLALLLSHAQAEVFAQKISIRAKNKPIKDVLMEIQHKTGYDFFYKNNTLKDVRTVSVNLHNADLAKVLNACLTGLPLKYEIDQKTVLITRKGEVVSTKREFQKMVSGTVLDENSRPLSAVSVRAVGQTVVLAQTDERGAFSVSVESTVKQLAFNSIGYEELVVDLKDDSPLRVQMQRALNTLDEVVALGFGVKQKKITSTGSVATISNKELMQSPTSNITNALAGRLPGLITMQRSGEPGRDKSDLYIRGVATLNSASPLVTIDGVQKDYAAITTLDPNEIENITILKDASSTALYGVKGANGVIIVTTKRGVEGKSKITLRTQTAVQSPTRIPRFLGSYDFATLYNEAYLNDNPTGAQIPYSEEALEAYRTGSDPLKYPDVDWAKELLQNSLSSQSNFSMSGGNKKIRYFVNVGYMHQGGIYKIEKNDLYNNNFELKRYNFRNNLDIDFDDDLSMTLNLYGAIEDRNYPNVSAATMFGALISRIPPNAFPIKYPTGYWGLHATGYSSPHALLNDSGFSQEFNSSLSGMASMTRKLNFITEGLSIKGSFAFDGYFKNTFKRSMNVQKAVYLGSGDYNDPSNYMYRDIDSPLSAPSSSYGQNRDVWVDVGFNYNRSFGKHNLIGLLLANRQQKVLGGEIPYVSQGLVGRVAYNYNDRYFAEFNAGYSGTDNFAKENRYGFFPALSAGYIVLRDHDLFSLLKVRGSYGISGNDQLTVTNRRWLFIEEYLAASGYSFGETLSGIGGIGEGPLANRLVSWENAYRGNIGLDVNLFGNGMLNATLDFFHEKRKDMLVLPQSIPYMLGIPASNLPPANFGETENKGFEIELNHHNRIGNVTYFVSANTSFARNKILAMDEETRLYPNLYKTGQRINQEFGLKALGFFESQEDIITSRPQTFGKVIPGDLKYYDANGDGVIDNNDVMPIGKSTIPEWMFGFSGGLNYKSFDFSFLIQGAAGYTYTRQLETAYEFYNGGKVMEIHKDRWTPQTAGTASYPVLHLGFNDNNHRASSFYNRKGDYIRLKNLELGYTFKNVQLFGSKRVDNIRLYTNGMNLFTWDSTEGDFDPESPGGRYWTYPQVKVFNFGLSTNF